MKQFLTALILSFSLSATSSARAESAGSQVLIIGATEDVKLAPEDDTLSFRSSVHWFWQPEIGTQLFFGYIGPKLKLSDWVWVSPQIGVAGNWTPEGHDAFLTSVWIGFTPHPNIFALVEGDVYFHGEGETDFYGFSFIEWSFGRVAVGPTLEQVNKDVIVGPHVTLYTQGGPFISFQYYVSADAELTQTARFVVGLFFL